MNGNRGSSVLCLLMLQRLLVSHVQIGVMMKDLDSGMYVRASYWESSEKFHNYHIIFIFCFLPGYDGAFICVRDVMY